MDDLDVLEECVACASITGAERPFSELAARLLEKEGFKAELHDAAPGRPNVLASDGERPRVVFSTHLDTVPPFIPPLRQGDVLKGRGSADAKGCFVAMLAAARKLRAEGAKGIAFLLVVGEEVDHGGAIAAARDEKLLADAKPRIILGEPTSAKVVVAQKGLLKAVLRAKGVAGHSAFPERGTSAIHMLVDAISRVRDDRWPSDPVLGPTTWNVGLFKGGVAANVFAPEAEAVIVFRLVSPALATQAHLERCCGAGVTVEVPSMNDPIRLDAPAGEPTCVVPFNTDASYLAPLGSVWLGGPGQIELAHSEDERITREELDAGVALYERLARKALEKPAS
jgi:acetylornithine deacetylase